jgi:hypothetical protein
MLPVMINQYARSLGVGVIGFIRWLFSRRVQNRFLVAFTSPRLPPALLDGILS